MFLIVVTVTTKNMYRTERFRISGLKTKFYLAAQCLLTFIPLFYTRNRWFFLKGKKQKLDIFFMLSDALNA